MKSVDLDWRSLFTRTYYVVESAFSSGSIVNTSAPVEGGGHEELSTATVKLPVPGVTLQVDETPYSQTPSPQTFPPMQVGSIYDGFDPTLAPYPVKRTLKYNLDCPQWFSRLDKGTYLAVDFHIRIPNEEVVECGLNSASDWIASVDLSEVFSRAQTVLTSYASVEGDASSHWYLRLLGETKKALPKAKLFIGFTFRSRGGTIAGTLTHFVTAVWTVTGLKLRTASRLTPRVSDDILGLSLIHI